MLGSGWNPLITGLEYPNCFCAEAIGDIAVAKTKNATLAKQIAVLVLVFIIGQI